MRKRALLLVAIASGLLATGAEAQGRRASPPPVNPNKGGDSGAAQANPPPTGAFPEPRTVEVLVTANGFSPAELTFTKGERIKLVVRRTTEDTCAKVLVIDEYLVWNELPLNLPFSTVFTVGRAGEFPFTCPSGETRGKIVVKDPEAKPAAQAAPSGG
ncbi:MAG TPA: cupredoxin domain-containing protein [Anaeromyxobacteraceae bacterium]|nr:cupredoxin domain-containing protein [Anaeromyxobacteraceae bacterium]